MPATATRYCLSNWYRENPPRYFVDDVEQQRGIVYQPDVYTMAETVTDLAGVGRIVDVGCGRADKLARIHDRHPPWELVGVDHGDNLKWCRNHYGWGRWHERDLERGLDVDVAAVYVCSDVIEHLADPIPLLQSLAEVEGPVVISTPERDLMYGKPHNGPPANLCHVREWNLAELRELLTRCGLDVQWLGVTRSSDESDWCATSLAVCR